MAAGERTIYIILNHIIQSFDHFLFSFYILFLSIDANVYPWIWNSWIKLTADSKSANDCQTWAPGGLQRCSTVRGNLAVTSQHHVTSLSCAPGLLVTALPVDTDKQIHWSLDTTRDYLQRLSTHMASEGLRKTFRGARRKSLQASRAQIWQSFAGLESALSLIHGLQTHEYTGCTCL